MGGTLKTTTNSKMKKGIGLYVIIVLVAIVIYVLVKRSNAIATTPPTIAVGEPSPVGSNNPLISFIEGLFKK